MPFPYGVQVEILAPAGSIQGLKTAIYHNADAVYLGVDVFSARAKSQDFTLDNLAEHVHFCHSYGVKVYLTLNTVVKDSEMPRALEVATAAYRAGVDAVLVQDVGLARVLHEALPSLALHASTQMGVHNVLGARFAKELGCVRVVVSRETPFSEIKRIKEEVGIEVEVFVHGALCVGFSGNCYYSSLVSGLSGNRGRCMQLCRKCYEASSGASGRLISPNDLCLVSEVEELKAAGVDSLKIEGRLKRPEYVAATVDAYIAARDGGQIDFTALTRAYQRGGFCKGYLTEANSAVDFVGAGAQGHVGEKIGAVSKVGYGYCFVKTEAQLSVNDGFKIMRGHSEVCGATSPKQVALGVYKLSTMGDVRVGDSVMLTTDSVMAERLTAVRRRIPVAFTVTAMPNEPLKAIAKTPTKTVSVCGEICQQAQSAPLAEDTVKQAFSKLGDTDFECVSMDVTLGNAFVPRSALNALRRTAVEKLLTPTEKEISLPALVKKTNFPSQKHSYVMTDEYEKLGAMDVGNRAWIYVPQDYSALKKSPCERVFLELPLIAFGQDLDVLCGKLDAIKSYCGVVCNNVYALQFAKEHGLKFIAGFGLNTTNFYAEYQQAYDVFFSVENTQEAGACAVFGVGEFPLMTYAHCPYKVATGKACARCAYDGKLTYTDEQGKTMRIRRMRVARCYFTLNDFVENPAKNLRSVDSLIGVDTEVECKILAKSRVLAKNNYWSRSVT